MKEITTDNLKRSASVLLFATIIVKLIGALFKLPLASDLLLGDLGFGYFSVAYDVFTPIYYIAISGFPVVVAKIISENLSLNKTEYAVNQFALLRKLILKLSIVLFSVYIAVLSFVYICYSNNPNKFYALFAIAPAIICCFVSSYYRGYFEGFENMMPAAISNVLEALGKLILGLGLAFISIKLGFDISISAAFAVLGVTLGTFASALYLKIKYSSLKKSKIKASNEKGMGIKLLLIALPIVLASLTTSVMAFIDSLTAANSSGVLNLNPNNFNELISEQENFNIQMLPTVLYGIKGKAFTLFNLIPTLTLSIGVALIPSVSKSYAEKSSYKLNENIGAVIKISSLIALPAGLGFALFGERIMELLYGVGASASLGGKMLSIYGIAAIFAGFCLPLAGILQSFGKQNAVFLNVSIGIILKIILNFLLCSIENINILGCAYSSLIAFAAIFVLHLINLIVKIKKIPNIIQNFFKPLIASVLCLGIGLAVSLIDDSKIFTISAIFTAIIVYFIVLILLKCFDESDFYFLPNSEKLIKLARKIKILP